MPVPLDTPRTTPAERALPQPSSRGALAGLLLSTFLASLGTSGANVGLPTIATVFGAPFPAVQWIVLAYLLAVTTMIVGAGRLGDIIGRRRLLALGISLFTGASLAAGLAPSLSLLIASRAVQGVGAAIMIALSMAFVSEAVAPARVGRAMGLLGTMSAVGTALGPSLGGMLLTLHGWRALFLINVPFGVAALWFVQRHLRGAPLPTARDRFFDLYGTALLAGSLGAFALAMTASGQRSESTRIALLGGAVVGAVLFLRRQARARVPLVPSALLRDRAFAARLASNALVACVMMSTLIVGPFYLTRALGLAPAVMGLTMTVGPILTALTGVPAGRFVDRRGASRAGMIGLAAMVVGSVLLAALAGELHVMGYLGPICFLTVGYALFQAANNTAVMATAMPHERGVVAGLLSLSRNLGLITGASLMGAVFARGSGVSDITAASADAVARGMRITFAVAAALVTLAIVLSRARRVRPLTVATLVLAAVFTMRADAQQHVVAPRDPYPAAAAGWGQQISRDISLIRWAEDWTARRVAGTAPALKALPIGAAVSLTMSGELRARHDAYANGRLQDGDRFRQDLLRATIGADVRLEHWLQGYAEITTGQVSGRRRESGANFQNDVAVQQLFANVRGHTGGVLLGAMLGRQEFADGPRQLLSVSDGPNLHRTWNGLRLYAHGRRVRVGAFDFRVTRPGRGAFDDAVDGGEQLRGVNASIIALRCASATLYVDPFWLRSDQPASRAGGLDGRDVRHTYGVRLWSRGRIMTGDWTLARQEGRHGEHAVEAWGVFAVQSLVLSRRWWQPRLDLRVDVASGGGTRGVGTRREFSPLYASTGYLNEGQFLSLANLALIAPGLTLAPASGTSVSLEYGLAWRMSSADPVRGGGMRAYSATRDVGGRRIGSLTRLSASRLVGDRSLLFVAYELLGAGPIFHRAQIPSGHYAIIGTTVRY